MNIIGTIALILMVTKYTKNDIEINTGLFKICMFFLVLISIWWKS